MAILSGLVSAFGLEAGKESMGDWGHRKLARAASPGHFLPDHYNGVTSHCCRCFDISGYAEEGNVGWLDQFCLLVEYSALVGLKF